MNDMADATPTCLFPAPPKDQRINTSKIGWYIGRPANAPPLSRRDIDYGVGATPTSVQEGCTESLMTALVALWLW